jgi:ADP-ribose pyrophosphatase
MSSQPLSADPFRVVSSETVYENPWIQIEHQDVIRPDGELGVYGIVHFSNRAIAIMPIEDNGDTWLVGQWRRPANMWSWEIPEGGVPFEEDLKVGALRELEEEVGLKAGNIMEILRFQPSNCVCDEVGVCFLAFDLQAGQMAPDPTEVLRVRRVHFTQLLEEIEQGQILDGPTQLTALKVYQLATTGRLPPHICAALLNPST